MKPSDIKAPWRVVRKEVKDPFVERYADYIASENLGPVEVPFYTTNEYFVEYACTRCGKRWGKWQKKVEAERGNCPGCGAIVQVAPEYATVEGMREREKKLSLIERIQKKLKEFYPSETTN